MSMTSKMHEIASIATGVGINYGTANMTVRDFSIEAAAKAIYEGKGDRIGKDYIGWDNEPEEVKDGWRVDVRATIDAYEAALRTFSA